MSAAWPFIHYSAYCCGEPDGDATGISVPAHLSPAEALTVARKQFDGDDAFLGEYVLRITGKRRWRETTSVENKIDGRAEDESHMVPAKRAGHEYWEIDLIPMRAATPQDQSGSAG